MSCTEISENLKTLPTQLEKFTKSLISIAQVNVFDSTGYSAEELNKLRDNIRQDVSNYADFAVPSCIEFLETLRHFVTKWSGFDFEVWLSKLGDITAELTKLHERCQQEYKNHVQLTGNLKSNKMSANTLAMKVKQMSIDKAIEKEKLEKSAESYGRWDTGMKILIIGWVINFGYSENQTRLEQSATRAGKESKLSEAAKNILEKDLIPALDTIIECLLQSSISLSKLRGNLITLTNQAEDALEEKLQEQYHAMQNSTVDICSTCRELYEIVPHVESDLLALKGRT